jgi:hypothetical protein
MTQNRERNDPQQTDDLGFRSTFESAGARGRDERREAVNPADNPAPVSPAADQEAIRKGEETLERVKPY